MVAESAFQFEALEAQAASLLELFRGHGYEPVAPAILQPADIFIDRMGEAIRSRTYVFTDLDGEELCLRPDLTVPACRLYLERHPDAGEGARYCYNGPAFRYQPAGNNGAAQPREFRQAGLEHIGGGDATAADAEVLGLAIEAVRKAGLRDFNLKLGDLGLFEALLAGLAIPERWRAQLQHAFWRPAAFQAQLNRLARGGSERQGALAALEGELDLEDLGKAEQTVGAWLDAQNVPLVGTRSLREIAERLVDQAKDSRGQPLRAATVELIESYLAVKGAPRACADRIQKLAQESGVDIDPALKKLVARLDAFERLGIDLNKATFGAEFGRNLEYYTGLVFQLEMPGLGRAGEIAGGGRYDNLLRELGAPRDVPAVGCAIHTERLLKVVRGRS